MTVQREELNTKKWGNVVTGEKLGPVSSGMMGFDADEWVVPVDICGVAAMYDTALSARTADFIS